MVSLLNKLFLFCLINMFSFVLHSSHSFTSLLSSHFLPFASHLSLSPSAPPLSPLRKWQASHGLEQCMASQVEAGPSPSHCIKAWETSSQKLVLWFLTISFCLPEVSMLETLSSGSPNKENSRKSDSLLNSTTPLKKIEYQCSTNLLH